MAVEAYRQTYIATTEPRQREYQLFAEITRELMAADRDGSGRIRLVKALAQNKRLWQVLQSDCISDENQLSDATRAGIISLAIWVQKHSRLVLRGEADLAALVQVNKTIMEGLAA